MHMRRAGHVARMGEVRNAYKVLVGKPEGKRPLGRSKHKWENNIGMDIWELGYEIMNWINVIQYRDQWQALVDTALNLRVP